MQMIQRQRLNSKQFILTTFSVRWNKQLEWMSEANPNHFLNLKVRLDERSKLSHIEPYPYIKWRINDLGTLLP